MLKISRPTSRVSKFFFFFFGPNVFRLFIVDKPRSIQSLRLMGALFRGQLLLLGRKWRGLNSYQNEYRLVSILIRTKTGRSHLLSGRKWTGLYYENENGEVIIRVGTKMDRSQFLLGRKWTGLKSCTDENGQVSILVWTKMDGSQLLSGRDWTVLNFVLKTKMDRSHNWPRS